MSEAIYEGTTNGYLVRVVYDPYPMSPREWDNASVFLFQHGRYDMPWEDPDAPKDVTLAELEAWVRDTYDDVAYVGVVYGYDHGGLNISLGNRGGPWDSGVVGLVYVRESNVCGTPADRAEDVAVQDVDLFNDYLTGDVYAYEVLAEQTCNLGHTHRTSVDSVHGFYANPSEVLAEAISVAENLPSVEEYLTATT